MKNFNLSWYELFRRPVLDQGLFPVTPAEVNQLSDSGRQALSHFLGEDQLEILQHVSLNQYVRESIELPVTQWKRGCLHGTKQNDELSSQYGQVERDFILSTVRQQTVVQYAVLRNVNVLMPQGIVWSDRKSEIYKETTMHANLRGSRRFFASSLNQWQVVKSPFLEKPIQTGTSCLFMYSPLYTNIFHLVHDLLWRQWAMSFLKGNSRFQCENTYFGPRLPGSRLDQFLDYLNLGQTLDLRWGVYQFKKLVIPFANSTYAPFPYAAPDVGFSGRLFNQDFYQWLYRDVVPTSHARALCSDNAPRLALLREDASHRNIANLAPVKQMLLQRKYIVFNPSEFSLSDQIYVFSKASKVVGVHGAALFNLIWTQNCSDVGEIFCGSHLDQGYRSVCGAKDIRYHCIVAKAVQSSHRMPGYQNLEVNLDDLTALLDAMDQD